MLKINLVCIKFLQRFCLTNVNTIQHSRYKMLRSRELMNKKLFFFAVSFSEASVLKVSKIEQFFFSSKYLLSKQLHYFVSYCNVIKI
jgi:hypothetical protein